MLSLAFDNRTLVLNCLLRILKKKLQKTYICSVQSENRGQFRNCPGQSGNSYFARRSISHFVKPIPTSYIAQDLILYQMTFPLCPTDSYFAQGMDQIKNR